MIYKEKLEKAINLLINNKYYSNVYYDKMLPTKASIIITEKCNLQCKYCFVQQSNDTMSIDILYKSIDFLYNNLLYNKKYAKEHNIQYPDNYIGLMLFGGEPTLFPKHIKKIYEYCKQKQIKTEIEIITNATIMTKYLYNTLKDIIYDDLIKLRVQLSVDGNKESQDTNRPTKSGKSSFDLILNNKKYYLELFKSLPFSLTIHGCLTKDSIKNLYNNFKLFKDWGFKHIWFIPIQEAEWEKEDWELYYLETKKIYEELLQEAIKTKNSKIFNLYSPISNVFNDNQNSVCSKPCGAGESFISISPNGNIYPCHQFYLEKRNDEYSHQFIIGNIFDGFDFDKKRIYDEYDGTDLLCDSNCVCIMDKCFRCISVNYMNKGSIFITPKKGYCEFMKIDNYFQALAKSAIKNCRVENE